MNKKIPEEVIQTDVLILGGGIAGLMAAIHVKAMCSMAQKRERIL